MSILLFLKVFADLCLCYAILGSFPTLFSHAFSFLWPAILAGGSVALASILNDLGKDKLRYGCILLPAFAFALCQNIPGALLVVPAVLYSAAIILRGNFDLEYYSFQDSFRKCLIWLGLFFIVILTLSFFESAVPAGQNTMDYKNTGLYGLLYAVCGVILQRQLRLGVENESSELRKKKAILSIGAIFLCMIGVIALDQLLRESASSVMARLTQGVGMFIGAIAWILRTLLEKTDPEFKDEFNDHMNVTEPQYTTPLPTYSGSEPPVQDVVEIGFPWWLVILMVVAVIVILLVMLRTFFQRGSYAGSGAVEEKLELQRPEKKTDKRSNRNKIRHYYRQFLRAERKKGLKRRENQTSADILNAISSTTDRSAAAALREEYLHARYDHDNEVTQAQVDRAKAALKKTRGGS